MKVLTTFATLTLFMISCVEVSTNESEVDLTKAPPVYIASNDPSKAELPFSEAVVFDNIIYVAGQTGEINLKLVEGGIIPETEQTLKNIQDILERNGSSMDNVIKCTCMLADIAEWGQMNSVYKNFFPKNKPARSALGASGLALNARVEIECMAYIDK